MDLKQLSYFVHVADLGSFTRAATLLGVAQPALSRQVRQLEVELRQSLLNRNGRGVTLTDAGARLLEHGRGILHQVERAREDLEEMRGAPVGHAALGVPPTVGRILTGPLVSAFRERYPKATLGIVEGLSTFLLERLASGRVDVGLVYNPPPMPAIEIEPLVVEPLYLIGPAETRGPRGRGGSPKIGAPVALRQLPEYGLVMPGRPNALRMYVEGQLAAIGARIDVTWEIDGIAAILDLVGRGLGHAVLPVNALRNEPLGVRLVPRPIVKPRLAVTLAIATSSQRPLTPLGRRVVDLVRELVPSELDGQARGPREGTS